MQIRTSWRRLETSARSGTARGESDGARWLTIGAPASLERYFLAIGRPAGGDGLPPEPIAPDVDAAAELERETGFRVELLGPPGALPGDMAA